MRIIKCITFDKEAQDNLPEHIKAKMKENQENARKIMIKQTEIYTAKTQLKEWIKFHDLVLKLNVNELRDKCFDEITTLNLKIEQLQDKTVTGG